MADSHWSTWDKSLSRNQSLGQGGGGLQLARAGTMCQSLEPKGVVGSNPPTPMLASVTSSEVGGGVVPK